MTLAEKKALAYDLINELNKVQNNLQVLNKSIVEEINNEKPDTPTKK